MNSYAARWRAIAVTILAFGLATAVLVGVWIGLNRVPSVGAMLPFTPTEPAGWAARMLPVSGLAVLVGIYIVFGAAVVALQSVYLDRMSEIFADVLLMVMAARVGVVLGSWLPLFALGDAPMLAVGELIPLAVLFLVVHVALFLIPHRIRPILLLRMLAVLALPIAGLALVSMPFFI